ncbi:MAG: peptide deformylase [Candidatus Omnitrophota bacterium]|nr:MAG: peptide deformylase [Candidatus Omnitrophota bacterium]
MRIGLRIHTWPESILRKKCKEVKIVDERIEQLFEQMVLLMRANKGIGLAANQVGLDLRLVVIETQTGILKLVNPRIVKTEGRIDFIEGCLSFPGIELKIKRARRVRVSALNEKGVALDYQAEGMLAVVFQHEVDHINGIPFIDRVSFWTRLKIRPLLKKIEKETRYGMCEQK